MRLVHTLALVLTVSLGAGCATRSTPDIPGVQTGQESEERRRAKIRLELASNYYQQKQYRTALEEIAKAVEIDGNFADLYVLRGIILKEGGQIESADASFKNALRIEPRNPDTLNTYGWFLCQAGREAESFQYFTASAKTPFYPSVEKPLQNAGICAIRLKQYAQAEGYLQQAQQVLPNQAIVLFNLAYAQLKQNKLAPARQNSDILLRGMRINSAEVLWLSLRVAHYQRDNNVKLELASRLSREFANSREWDAFQRGAFDE